MTRQEYLQQEVDKWQFYQVTYLTPQGFTRKPVIASSEEEARQYITDRYPNAIISHVMHVTA